MLKAVFSAIELEGDTGAAEVWSHLETLETLLEKQRQQLQHSLLHQLLTIQ